MLKGLEITIKSKLEAFDEFYKSRIDPEFFQEYYLELDSIVRSKNHDNLGEVAFVTDGDHGNAKTTPTGYSKYYGARNVLSGILNDNGVEFITKERHDKLRKTALNPRDVLISCVGANIGFSSIVPDDIGLGNIVRNVALIRPNDSYLNEYVHAYLLSKYGKSLYIRMNSGNAQPLVSLDYIGTIPVFKPSDKFQKDIKSLVNSSLDKLNISKIKYKEAEVLLYENLGLSNFTPCSEPINIKGFKESFTSSGRLDAEYYQLKYEDYVALINSYPNGVKLLGEVCEIKDSNFNPTDNVEYKYIELANIGKSGEIVGCTYDFGSELPTRARRKVNTDDVIISSIEGSLESCGLVTKAFTGSICSTGFYVLSSSELNPETLLVLFKSEPLQNLLKKGCSGTILTAIGKPELFKIPIPLIDNDTQEIIKEKIIESSKLRTQSAQLLQLAKKAVEKAIEESEDISTKYFNKKLLELKIDE